MTFEDLDYEDELGIEDDEDVLPEEAGNRMFLMVAGILGAVAVLTIICIVAFFVIRGTQNGGLGEVDAANTQQAEEVEQIIRQTATSAANTAIAAAWTATPTATQPVPTNTSAPPTTAVVAVGTGEATLEAINATATSLQATANYNAEIMDATLTARLTTTVTGVPEQIPDTGFADNIGLPAMLIAAAALILVIFLARRLRSAS